MELPRRKNTRLKEYDYSGTGAYFITLCTKGRKPILSRIVGDGVLDIPKTVLSKYGKAVDKRIRLIDMHYDNIKIDNYVIMPNHIHILISVYNNGTSRMPSPTNDTIPSFVGTLKRFVNREVGEDVFQRSYYDHIIRDERDYLSRWQYIANNPIKWEEDELIKDYVNKLHIT